MFPSAPALSVVKHVVKEPFSTRCGIRCLSRRALFHVWGLRYCTSGKASMQVISITQAYQFLARLIKEYSPAGGRTFLICLGASKSLQLCVLQPGYSDCLDSAGTPYQCPCLDRKRKSPLCSVEHFAEPGFEFCSPCPPGRSTCNPADALVHGKRYIPSFRETRENRICYQSV